MFRGVLFSALSTRLRLWLAIAVTTVLFGSVHLLNFLVIGDLPITVTQAIAAAMSGTLFIAIRLRTGSLYPAIAFHALWDFGTLMAVAKVLSMPGASGGAAMGAAAGGSPGVATLLLPIGLLLPNFLYALFLLRRCSNAGDAYCSIRLFEEAAAVGGFDAQPAFPAVANDADRHLGARRAPADPELAIEIGEPFHRAVPDVGDDVAAAACRPCAAGPPSATLITTTSPSLSAENTPSQGRGGAVGLAAHQGGRPGSAAGDRSAPPC